MRGTVANEERRKVASVRVAKSSRSAVVDSDEKSSEAVVARVVHQVFVQPRHEVCGADGLAALRERLTAQSRLQTGHEQRGRDPLPGNVRDGNGHMRWTELNEVVVVSAYRARSFADRLDLNPRNR